MKIISYYLPQFHTIPENDEWWGKDFTEWVNVKKAKPLFENHYQPRIPLEKNYYNLLDPNTIKWQINLAKNYGLYGFCIYHYWFNGKLLLEKPLELFRDNDEINFPYCICWANEDWTNAWVANGDVKTLIRQDYGNKVDWEKHFEYFLSFFKDENYIKEDNKPLLVIYRPEIIENLNEMLDYWNSMAIKNGFSGIKYAYQQLTFDLMKEKDDSRFSYNIEYQPGYARYDIRHDTDDMTTRLLFKTKNTIRNIITKIDKKFKTNLSARITRKGLKLEDYNMLCNAIVKRHAQNEKSVAGMYVGWDNSPRKGENGQISLNSTPERFEYYLRKQIENVKKNYSNDMLFIFAWNEWAEGGYLEPDEKYQYKYLQAIKNALDTTQS